MPRKWWEEDPGYSPHPGQDYQGDPGYPGGAPYSGPGASPPAGPAPTTPPSNPTPPGLPPDYGNFDIPNYGGPTSPSYNFGPVPLFNPPQFNVPSFADAQNEPGYQFRLNAGTSALQNSAAAKGMLRTGGTLKDLIEYGQNFGAQEYQNVFNRALQAYQPAYQAAKDQFAPLFAQYNNQFGAEQGRGNLAFGRQWDAYQAMLDALFRKEGLLGNVLNTPPPTPPGSY